MRFVCDQKTISDAVANVSKAVADRTAYKILEGIRFVLNENSLELTGYDLQLGIRTTLSVRSSESGSFVANSKLFGEMVRKMPSGDLMIEVTENNIITIESGATSYNMNASDADEYPVLPEKNPGNEIKTPQAVLKNMILQTKFAASQLDNKPILKGELFEIENSQLTIAAIDGYRLAVRREPVNYDKSVSFVVPAKNLEEAAKLLSDDENEICSMFLSEKHIIFEIGGYLVNSRLLEGEFHPYKSAIPSNCSTEMIVSRSKLIDSLERCLLLISEKSPSPVRCTFADGQVKIKCNTASLGKVYDEIDADMKGSPVEIGFKCRYFLDPLKAVTDEKVKIQLSGSLHPMKIVPVNDENYIYLVLPVRLPKE